MYPIAFRLGSLTFYTHGIFAVLGIIAASLALYFLVRKKMATVFLFDTVIYSVLAGIVGARLAFIALYSNQFGSFKEYLYLWQGGLVSYGGFIAGALAFILILRRQKQPVGPWLDNIAIAFPLGLSIARIGEVISGEDFGIATSSPVAIRGTVPTSLIEGLWCLVIFFILLGNSRRLLKNPKYTGALTLILVLMYSSGRFVIDFWRDDNRILFHLSLGQITSLIIFIIAVLLSLYGALRQKGKYGIITRTN